jgi:hypothetical protein
MQQKCALLQSQRTVTILQALLLYTDIDYCANAGVLSYCIIRSMVKYIVDSPDNVARMLLSYFTMSMVSAAPAARSLHARDDTLALPLSVVASETPVSYTTTSLRYHVVA